MSATSYRRLTDVETTSRVYWVDADFPTITYKEQREKCPNVQ